MENQSRKRGSRTAEITALIRANHLLNNPKPWIIEDPYAIHFLSRRWRKALQPGPWQWLLYHFSFKKMAAVASHVLYRARISEQYALKAVAKGARQVVILGAGYDTFALRHPNLPAQIFEVDLPTTGAIKQQRMKAAKIPHPCHLHLVAVDFERDDLGERLIAAGFDPQSPCFLTWMGVTYYLARTAIAKTLSKLDSLTAPGSELLLDYMTPPELIPPQSGPLLIGC